MESKFSARSFKQDPQSNLSIAIFEGLCDGTFLLWDLDDQEIPTHRGRLIFQGCWAAEYLGVEMYTCDRPSEFCLPNIFLPVIGESQWRANKSDIDAKI